MESRMSWASRAPSMQPAACCRLRGRAQVTGMVLSLALLAGCIAGEVHGPRSLAATDTALRDLEGNLGADPSQCLDYLGLCEHAMRLCLMAGDSADVQSLCRDIKARCDGNLVKYCGVSVDDAGAQPVPDGAASPDAGTPPPVPDGAASPDSVPPSPAPDSAPAAAADASPAGGCGNGKCDGDEDCGSCPADCGDCPAGPDPILVGAGDIAKCSYMNCEKTATLLDAIFASNPPGLIFAAGDTSNESGTPAEYANCFDPTWGRHKPLIRPAVGNHEYLTAGASGYFGYFGTAAGPSDKGYYSYDLGRWHIVVLNSNCSKVGGCQVGSAQERWLRSDLQASPTKCTLAYWHHPRFSSGQWGSFVSMQPIWQALQDNGAEIVLSGHDHDYERFAPQTATGAPDPAFGIRQFVVGTGGATHGGPINAILANSEAHNGSVDGVLKLTLHPSSYDWEFIPIAGDSFTDSGSTPCH